MCLLMYLIKTFVRTIILLRFITIRINVYGTSEFHYAHNTPLNMSRVQRCIPLYYFKLDFNETCIFVYILYRTHTHVYYIVYAVYALIYFIVSFIRYKYQIIINPRKSTLSRTRFSLETFLVSSCFPLSIVYEPIFGIQTFVSCPRSFVRGLPQHQ